ncbi:ras GEF [Marasmius fiardii PR-910]|nr:ras GEF [Marasmius fiardii PR-910]
MATMTASSYRPAATFLPSTSTSPSVQLIDSHPQQESEFDDEDSYPPPLFCRALYDYTAQDASALTFRTGDIIEILSQQPSGWWDGLLGDERGWFPSNYVVIMSEEEAEIHMSGSESNAESQTLNSNSHSRFSVVEMSEALMRGSSTENEKWLESELSGAGDSMDELANAAFENRTTSSSDFWMPQVASNGQIYYINTKTGQHSRDLPQEADDDTSESELAGLTSQSSSRSGTSAGLGYSSDSFNSSLTRSVGDPAGFGLLRRNGTPEPWIKKLADDGMSYYYYNKEDGTVQWTRPESTPNGPRILGPRSQSSNHATSHPPNHHVNGTRRLSVYSDSSEIHPDPDTARPHINGFTDNNHVARTTIAAKPEEPELTSAERIAQSLQQALAPPPPELVTDLSASAQASIQAVVENIQSTTGIRQPEDDQRMDDLIHSVVLAVRNLLYVAAVPTSQIPSNVMPRGMRERQPASSNSPLKPAQRKVTATLSRLVLSARAIQYDSGSSPSDTLNRIEVDAEELERAVLSFVLEVQRTQHSGSDGQALPPTKRLKAVFGTSNIGLGLPGAGAAGTWKGFGWVSLENESQSPQQVLRIDVTDEVSESCNRIYSSLALLNVAVRAPEQCEVDRIHLLAKETTALISSFLTYMADVNVGRHVVIDAPTETSTNALYDRTVEKARMLVRTLESSIQSVYDDCAEVLLQAQAMRDIELGQPYQERDYACDMLNVLVTSLKANLAVVQQTLQGILTLGHEQRDISQGDYSGSIEKRFSRQSLIGVQFGGALRPISIVPKAFDEEDIVDFETAFQRGPARPRPQAPLEPNRYDPNRRPQNGSLPPSNVSSSHGHDRSDSVAELTVFGQNATDSGDLLIDEDQSPRSEDNHKSKMKQSDKLMRLLGTDVPLPPEEKPWFLGPDSDPADLLLDVDRTVKGGTIKALVERLTAHDTADPQYSKAFLMTFKSFTTLDELFDLLVDRFRIPPPPKLAPNETEQWVRLKQKIVQARVINTFKSMITDDDVLEKEDLYILNRMKEFVSSEDVSVFPAAKQLSILIERAQQSGETKKLIVNTAQAPPPILPKTSKKLKLLDIEPLELARQLTLLESSLYQKIRPMECLQRAREQKAENMDNIAFVIQTSNRIADWVAESVLSKDDSRRRAATVKHLISVADRCRTLNNFSTMIAIISGLNTPPIRRLKRTWEQVSQRYMAQFGACEVTLDSNRNFNKYRSMLASVVPPCVPFIGVFLSTLQFIQDGIPDNLPGNLVNFKKRQKASEVINDIKRWQAHSFNFQPVPAIRDYIEESLSAFSDTRVSSERFWAMSLEREPREREDEKMARLLQESGFL